MKKIWTSVAIILLAAGCTQKSAVLQSPAYDYSHKLSVGNKTILVEIADTEQKQTQGLSGRPRLTDNQGMLFNFGTSTMPTFWMKDMKFNLDLIWISQNQIISMTPDVTAPKSSTDELPLYRPPSNVDEVLEVNAGWSKNASIKPGDEVKISAP